MTIHQIHPDPLGAAQRETLMLAESGDVGLVKGVSAQRKALVRKGMLGADYSLTDLGRAQLEYEHGLQRPLAFFDLSALLGQHFHKQAHAGNVAKAQGYGTPNYVGTVSADGRTGYVVRRSAKGKGQDVHAVVMSTVPSEFVGFFTGSNPLVAAR